MQYIYCNINILYIYTHTHTHIYCWLGMSNCFYNNLISCLLRDTKSQTSHSQNLCNPKQNTSAILAAFTLLHFWLCSMVLSQKYCTVTLKKMWTAMAQWLRFCATNRQVAGSIPDGVNGLFRWHNPSDRTMALGSTQPLTEMSTRCISWG
jgi:hypothetical protein